MKSPIGIFDSGLGGLTVFREIARQLPEEDLIYVGDTARVPYGVKSPETVTRYSREICQFLKARGVKAIVVACNTASSLALPHLNGEGGIPLLGVLEPGAAAAVRASHSQRIGVIGTEATVKSQSYAKAIRVKLAGAHVTSRACPLFVPLVEEGWIDHEVTRLVAQIYLGELAKEEIDTLILGCTHYPLLKGVIQEVLGEKVQLVDSALETARALEGLLKSRGLREGKGPVGAQQFFTTDDPEKFKRHAALFLGHPGPQAQLTHLDLEGF